MNASAEPEAGAATDQTINAGVELIAEHHEVNCLLDIFEPCQCREQRRMVFHRPDVGGDADKRGRGAEPYTPP